MEKYSRRHLKRIQTIVQDKTGITLHGHRKAVSDKMKWVAPLTACLLCFVLLSAFAYGKFSDLDGDEVGFGVAYQGNGRFEIVVSNLSDRELKLQDRVKVMQWSTAKEVDGDNGKIKMSGLTIAPHSQGVVLIDLSDGYDVEAMEENLPDGDWYYFVLTNNYFAFGQDWMCSFGFEIEQTEDVAHNLTVQMERSAENRNAQNQGTENQSTGNRDTENQNAAEHSNMTGSLRDPDWIWPTVSQTVSASYGEQRNGNFSDHINIAGSLGDEVYAVAGGIVVETAFESTEGNVIVIDLGNGVTVKYGHLKEINLSEGDEVAQGQVIATLGKTGMATGPNLSFAVSVNGEEVNPLEESNPEVGNE